MKRDDTKRCKCGENETYSFCKIVMEYEKTYDNRGFASCSCVRKDTCFIVVQVVIW
jgi:hypothetical protein